MATLECGLMSTGGGVDTLIYCMEYLEQFDQGKWDFRRFTKEQTTGGRTLLVNIRGIQQVDRHTYVELMRRDAGILWQQMSVSECALSKYDTRGLSHRQTIKTFYLQWVGR